MKSLILAATLALAACGVDGPPAAPQAAAEPGVSFDAEASIGVRTDDL